MQRMSVILDDDVFFLSFFMICTHCSFVVYHFKCFKVRWIL